MLDPVLGHNAGRTVDAGDDPVAISTSEEPADERPDERLAAVSGHHEPACLRPAIMVSHDTVSSGPSEPVVVVPVTSTDYGLRNHIEIAAGVSGLEHTS